MMPAFFLPKTAFFCKNSTLLKAVVWDIFSSFYTFSRMKKFFINENVEIIDHTSRIRGKDHSKSAINWKNNNDVIIYWHDIIVKFFDVAVFLLSNLVTGSSFMSISFLGLKLWQFLCIRDLTRNSEIGNTSVWVLSKIRRLGWVRDTKFGMNISNRKLLNAVKWQVYQPRPQSNF